MQANRSILKSLSDDVRFLKSWMMKPRSTGSIKPTGRAAAKLMVSLIPKTSHLPVLELGPGTGVITKTMIEFGIPPEQIICIEQNADFIRHLETSLPDVKVINGDAFDLKGTMNLDSKESFRAVLSGIPLLNFPQHEREALITGALEVMEVGAPFVQLCYGPKPPIKAKPGFYSVTPTRWVLNNVPPARYWVYKREK